MIVIVLEKCPKSLRGDLTRWLSEISTGVYVGKVNARVRDKLWERIQGSIPDGRGTALMAFSTDTEQGYDFRTHNTAWVPCDFDGLQLIMRSASTHQHIDTHKEAQKRKYRSGVRRYNKGIGPYVAIDIETTGLNPDTDDIIEIGAVKIIDGQESTLSMLIKQQKPIPESIEKLTGISDEDLANGVDLREALTRLIRFCGNLPLVAHNAQFDSAFLEEALFRIGFDEMPNQVIDTLELARKKCPSLSSYKLDAVFAHWCAHCEPLGLQEHRALDDARRVAMTYGAMMES